jgi:biopolymer transport protein ExbD
MQALVVLVIILGASFIAYMILKEKKPHVDLPSEEKTKKEEYPIIMSASVPSSSSSVLGKVETPEASPELIAAVVKTAAKPKPKKKVVKKEIAIKKERKPKDKGNDMLLS